MYTYEIIQPLLVPFKLGIFITEETNSDKDNTVY